MSVVERVRNIIAPEENENQSQESDGELSEEGEPRSTRLYRCDSCDLTYVSEAMDTCPRCRAPVETTPTEEELGLL